MTALCSSSFARGQALLRADAVIVAVLAPGAHAPELITEKMVASMHPGVVIVDVAIDQWMY